MISEIGIWIIERKYEVRANFKKWNRGRVVSEPDVDATLYVSGRHRQLRAGTDGLLKQVPCVQNCLHLRRDGAEGRQILRNADTEAWVAVLGRLLIRVDCSSGIAGNPSIHRGELCIGEVEVGFHPGRYHVKPLLRNMGLNFVKARRGRSDPWGSCDRIADASLESVELTVYKKPDPLRRIFFTAEDQEPVASTLGGYK